MIDGDDFYGERCELGRNEHRSGEAGGAGTFALYSEGQRRITFFSVRLPSSYPIADSRWQGVLQMKQTQPADGAGGGPALSLSAFGGQWLLSHSLHPEGANPDMEQLWSTPATTGVWTRVAFDVLYSQDQTQGFVKVYIDLNGDGDAVDSGEQSPGFSTFTLKREVTDPAGQSGDLDGIEPGESIPSHLRVGVYHNPTIPCPTPTGCSVETDNLQVFDVPAVPAADTSPPDTTITSGPTGITTSTSASFDFTSSETGSTFTCSLDGGAYSSCASPRTYAGLSQGSHIFRVKATDPASNEDPNAAERSWEVDSSTYAAAVRGDTPQGYWRFQELSGSGAAAQVGPVSGVHGAGATAGAASLGTQLGASVDYSGVAGAQTEFGDAFDFSGTQPFTLEFWARPDTVDATYRRLVSKQSSAGGTQGYTIYSVAGVDGIGFQRFRDGIADTAKCSALATGATHHVVGTYDGSTLRLYKNGAQCASILSTRSLMDNTGSFQIGSTSILTGRNFDGRVDEPAVYSRALSAAEVLEHYQAGP